MTLSAPKEYEVRIATRQPRANFHIPPQFFDAIILHVVKNTLDFLDSSLLLIIQGPKGEGKSSQTLEVCSRMGINAVIIPGSSLGGEFEKEPVNILREAYLQASALREATNAYAVLIIEDLDTSIASFRPDTKFTVNSQLLSGALMYLCQSPNQIGDIPCHRIPIIASGNDFTYFYEPLTRHGRATFFDWLPDLDTKKQIIRQMYEGLIYNRELERIGEFVEHFSSLPIQTESISFYQQVRNDIFDELILNTVYEYGAMDFARIREKIIEHKVSLSIEDLIEIGERRRNSRPKKFIGDFGGN